MSQECQVSISVDSNVIRKMALEMLDEQDGIKKSVYETLSDILRKTDNEDIIEQVDVTETRAYIGESVAEEELAKLEAKLKAEESEEVEEETKPELELQE